MNILDSTLCYEMLRARDARFDGLFFVGVKTTGIYCRTICPARTPRASSCVFFETAVLAEKTGFRPCLRCRPELAPQQIKEALPHAVFRHLQKRAVSGFSIETLADEIGFSPRHLRRMMKENFGVTPVSILQTERMLFAKKILQDSALTVTDIADIAGFGSLRRMNALFQSRYRLSPTALRRAGGDRHDGGEFIVLRLGFRPPFAWDALLCFFKTRAIPGVENVTDDGVYERSIRINSESGYLRVSMDTCRNSLRVEVSVSLSKHLFLILSQVRMMFDLDANPAIIADHLEKDKSLRCGIKQTPGLRVPGAWDSFETSIRAVLGQQISVAGASTLAGRLVRRFGTPLSTNSSELAFLFPTAAEIAATPVKKIAELGMPRSRAQTIQNVAVFAESGGLACKTGESSRSRINAIITVKGIGEWTAQYVGMRVFRDPDAFPAGDLGLQKGANCDAKELLEKSQNWRPWRAYAAMYLWESLHSKQK